MERPGDRVEVGLFGKLPSHGDFLRRRAPDAFVDAWDAWLRECLVSARETLGDGWLDLYLTSPAWRFVLAAGACGPSPVIGLMAPSVDRVGRYFPFTLVATLPADVNPIAATSRTADFFERAEQLIVQTLATDEIDFEQFDQDVIELGETLQPGTLPPRLLLDPTSAAILEDAGSWQIPIESASQLGPSFEQLLADRLMTLYEPMALWWTEGSTAVEPCCLFTKGLPHPEAFAAFLDGSWTDHRWRAVGAHFDTEATVAFRVEPPAPPAGFRSAASTNVGLVRRVNQDAFIERPEIGLWAVADGLGGHRDGEVASRMVCDALGDLMPMPTFEGTIDAVRQRLQRVNDYLLRDAAHAALADRAASTVVVLLVRGTACAVLWAGDSRVYRWRAGRLERLTRDHSAEASGLIPAGETSTAVTRAVGVQEMLGLDLRRDTVRAGDRFLLCSDGLTRMVAESQFGPVIGGPDVGEAVEALIASTLAAGASDNVTAIVVEAWGR